MNKKTVIIGASTNPERYSYKAIVSLKNHGHEVVALAIKEGEIGNTKFITSKLPLYEIHTVSMYINAQNQEDWVDYILNLKPKRIIFNPGTENSTFYKSATQLGIVCEEACTLVLLSIGNY
jgi:uncharacterized protein